MSCPWIVVDSCACLGANRNRPSGWGARAIQTLELSTALAILGTHAMRGYCVSTLVGTTRTKAHRCNGVIGKFGRHAHPVVRPGFKPGGGRQPFPARFDSCYLPPWPRHKTTHPPSALITNSPLP